MHAGPDGPSQQLRLPRAAGGERKLEESLGQPGAVPHRPWGHETGIAETF